MICVGVTCTDGLADGAETDVDCGASCAPCADDAHCQQGTDCRSGICGADGRCRAPSCSDQIKNGQETDVDCGGGCPDCTADESCLANADCDSGLCKAGRCAKTLETGALNLVARHSNKCMDVAANSSADGTTIQQYTCNGEGGQLLQLEALGGALYRIRHLSSGKCVDVDGGGFADNTNVQLYGCNGTTAQIFEAFPTSDGYFAFRRFDKGANRHTCLDVYGGDGATADRVRVTQWSCTYNANQQWLPN